MSDSNKFEVETPNRTAARQYLTVGDYFGGRNRLFSLEEVESIVAAAPVSDDVKKAFQDWLKRIRDAQVFEVWGHSVRGVARQWYWDEAGISWPGNMGMQF